MIVIPEEAELLIPLVCHAETPLTHLLTYAAPVTRKTLQFDDLRYYAMPSLPTGWKAPTWLRIELGIFAGRLYFEYSEYSDLCKYLGLGEAAAKLAETTDMTVVPAELDGPVEEPVEGDAADEKVEMDMRARHAQSFTTKPLSFLQEWLAVRRKGQDFAHTPMGYVCQGKPLTASHPFFTRREDDGALKPDAADMRNDRRMDADADADVDADADADSMDGDFDFDEEVQGSDGSRNGEEDQNEMFLGSDPV